MRTFVAAQLDDECRQRLLDAIAALRRVAKNVRWVREAQLHLTLKFIGEIQDRDLPCAIGALRAAADSAGRPFTMHVAGLSAFPPRGKPRVIHVEVRETTGALQDLHHVIEQALAEQLAVAPESRAYVPHITVGRVRDRRTAPHTDELAAALPEQDFGRVSVTSFVLMRSELKPTGAEYSVLHEFLLE